MAEHKVYVGGLAYSATEDDLYDLFDKYGTIKRVQVIADRETGKPRGFGFVEFDTHHEANAAIDGADGRKINGREITVNMARGKDESRGGRGGGGSFGRGGGGDRYGGGGDRYGGGGDRGFRGDRDGDRGFRGDRDGDRGFRGGRGGDRSFRGGRDGDRGFSGGDRRYSGGRDDDRGFRGGRGGFRGGRGGFGGGRGGNSYGGGQRSYRD